MKNLAKEALDQINWKKMTNTKLLPVELADEHYIALLEIRGEVYKLSFYDYYMVEAINLTDGIKGIDFRYVYNLRTAIREDYNHFIGAMMNMLYDQERYNLLALDKIIEIFNDYQGQGWSSHFDINERIKELAVILIAVNSNES